jgi:hypothetical protein
MVYSGQWYTVVPYGSWPQALSPLLVTAQPSNMAPQTPTSIQWNFGGDDMYYQFVLFAYGGPQTTQGPAPNQVGFGIAASYVQPQYTSPGPGQGPVSTNYAQIDGLSVGINAVNNFNGNPILISDLMNGRYRASLTIDTPALEAFLVLYDTQNNNFPVWDSMEAGGWNNNVEGPTNLQGLPKAIQCQLLGLVDQPATFTTGSFKATYASIQSTQQGTGVELPLCQIRAVPNNPTWTDPLTGNVYIYPIESGELSNLNSVFSDISPSITPQTVLQQLDTPAV